MPPSSSKVTTLFPTTETPSDFWGASGSAYEPMWRQMGADNCRAILFDLASLQPLAGRWMRENGSLCGELQAAELDAAFQGTEAMMMQWAQEAQTNEQPLRAQMLSPRRWVYLWRADVNTGLVAQVQYLNSRSSPHEFDTTGVQLLCEHWLGGERQARREAQASAADTVWNRVERRASGGLQTIPWPAVACMLVGLSMALWLMVGAAGMASAQVAAHQRDHARLAEVADGMAVQSLAHALSSGDYGEVQQVLTMKATAGHFADAAVTNARGQVVALAGEPDGLRIGAVAPLNVLGAARVMPLSSGNNKLGSLLVMPTPSSTVKTLDLPLSLRVAGAVLGLVIVGAAVLMWRKPRRAGPSGAAARAR